MSARVFPLKRLSRPETPPRFRLMERDVTILRAVARFRFLSSDQIVRLLGNPSHQSILRRLHLLYCNRLLDRPVHQHAQLAAFFDYGNRPLVYGLAREGARILVELGMPIDHKLDWTTKNARATAYFLAHTLEVADAMIAFDLASRGGGTAYHRPPRASAAHAREDARRARSLSLPRHGVAEGP